MARAQSYMKPDRIQDLRELEDRLYEAVQQCIEDPEASFPLEGVEWQSLVTADGEPDVDAINEVASGFVFVR